MLGEGAGAGGISGGPTSPASAPPPPHSPPVTPHLLLFYGRRTLESPRPIPRNPRTLTAGDPRGRRHPPQGATADRGTTARATTTPSPAAPTLPLSVLHRDEDEKEMSESERWWGPLTCEWPPGLLDRCGHAAVLLQKKQAAGTKFLPKEKETRNKKETRKRKETRNKKETRK
jgi:hypothetical protein